MTNLSYDHRVGYVSMGMGAESQESVCGIGSPNEATAIRQ